MPSRKLLQNNILLVKLGVDTTENGPCKGCVTYPPTPPPLGQINSYGFKVQLFCNCILRQRPLAVLSSSLRIGQERPEQRPLTKGVADDQKEVILSISLKIILQISGIGGNLAKDNSISRNIWRLCWMPNNSLCLLRMRLNFDIDFVAAPQRMFNA